MKMIPMMLLFLFLIGCTETTEATKEDCAELPSDVTAVSGSGDVTPTND
jgi:hypothetical protein